MFGRVKDAMADAAETLRQAFAGLKVVEVTAEPFQPRTRGTEVLGAEAAVARRVCLGEEAEAGHAARGSQMQGTGVATDEEGETAGEAGQLAHAGQG
jgi:hypothetical protein